MAVATMAGKAGAVGDVARDAYEAMAPAYDRFTAHHDYATWTAILERLARTARLDGTRLLDVGCGTGKSFAPFLDRGWDVTACDLSPAMLERAEARSRGRATLSVQDARELPILGEFDLVLLLDDVVNHLDDAAELTAAFEGARRNLAPGGVLLFDANTLLAYRSFFATTEVVHDDDGILVWHGQTSPDAPPGTEAPGELLAWTERPDGSWDLHRSRPTQRHHPRATVERALRTAGFAWHDVFGMQLDGTLRAGLDELEDTKALYLARTSAP